MKRSAIIFFILVSFIAGIFWYGSTLPEESHISVSQTFNRSEEDIRKLIFDFSKYPEWRENIYAVKEIPSTTEFHAWKEIDGDGKVKPLQMTEFNHNNLVTLITIEVTGDKSGTSGRWHFDIVGSEDGSSTRVTITEDRKIPGLMNRVLRHLLNERTEDIDSFFRSINNKFIGDERRRKHKKSRQDMQEIVRTRNQQTGTLLKQPQTPANQPRAVSPDPSNTTVPVHHP